LGEKDQGESNAVIAIDVRFGRHVGDEIYLTGDDDSDDGWVWAYTGLGLFLR
jgi:hypothetical protein